MTSGIGVLLHVDNPTVADVQAVALASEAAGADYLGVPDAFWWRDTWLLSAAAAAVTTRLDVGPFVTNPYTRHPFQTVASLATLQEQASGRVRLALGAGGSELSAAAGINRHDAATRIRALARLIRSVAAGEPLDPGSGRRLDVPLDEVLVVVAGRADGVLRAGGAVGDAVLLWAIPHPDLARSAEVVAAGARAGRHAPGPSPELIWAPVVDYDGAALARGTVAYSVLNSHAGLHERWGLSPDDVERLRTVLVTEGNLAASALVPEGAAPDLVLSAADIDGAAALATQIGARSIAVRATSADAVAGAVAWAREVLAACG